MAQKSLDDAGNTLNVECLVPSVAPHKNGLWICVDVIYVQGPLK